MSFLHPEFLYYMLPPLFILFGLLLTQKETQAHFFSKEVMDKLRVSANNLTLRARNALFLMIGFFIIIALAQPVIDDGVVTVKAKSADIMIALDISDSMLAEDVYPNRLELAKQKAFTLLSKSPNERIGIMAFAKNSYLVSPLSFDTSAVSFLLTQLDTTSITQKGTDFLSILDVFSKSQKSEGEKYLLIFSDGGDSDDFKDEIALAQKNNIVVFILGIGTTKGAPIKLKDGNFIKQHGKILVSKLNENIAELATSSGGVYIQNTTSTSDIEAMLAEIKSISKEKELKSEEIHKYIPLFYYPIGIALFLLLIATSSMSKRVRVELPSLLVLCLFMSASVNLRADILDFMDLSEAKEAYKSEQYEKSAKLYEKYAEESKKGESYFNAGNSLYKQKKYEEAVNLYEKATFDDENLRAKNFSNMGNAYAKGQNLQKAVEVYEKSLKIEEDKDTRENLEEVKKLLKKQKQDSKKSDKQNTEKQKAVQITELSLTEIEINKEIEKSEFKSISDINNALLLTDAKKEYSEIKKNIENKKIELNTTKKHISNNSEELNSSKNFDISEEEIISKLGTLKDLEKNNFERNGDINRQIKKDDEIRNRNKNVTEKIDKQNAVLKKWDTLQALLGGSKDALNTYVQRLTLENLITLANVHLFKLNRRYSLKINNTFKKGEELSFVLVDHFQTGRTRPVDTTSGGEKFLISLALALGLSDLASNNVKIDSLFIDEGFGTLDPNMLETVISTLETLQSEGKMIGVISHVENLKERISTQIQVIKNSNGISTIEIV